VREATTVTIIGGGVSGLTTALLLRRCGVRCVVLERRSRGYVEQRQRAGLVEYRGVRMFRDWGLGDLVAGFPPDRGLEVRVDGESHLLVNQVAGDAGQSVPQQAIVRKMIALLLADGADLRFDASDVSISGDARLVGYTDADGTAHEIESDFVAGCDGDRGVAAGYLKGTTYATDFGISWLTILADTPPPAYALMAVGERGYAAQYSRGPAASRFYLRCDPDDTPGDWPATRIWEQLRFRLHQPGLPEGPITETEVFPLRALIREPMSQGRLFLLGDAAHVISPMGAKGMNLALFDAEVFATAVRDFTRDGDEAGLRDYSSVCLRRNWRYQEFSHWMTEMLMPPADPFLSRLARARLDRALNTEAGARYYAEMMTGLG
jgi:p-hydroxybenzoate 3-monooxygenase